MVEMADAEAFLWWLRVMTKMRWHVQARHSAWACRWGGDHAELRRCLRMTTLASACLDFEDDAMASR